MNMTLGSILLRDRRVPIRTKLIALGIGAATIGAIELLQLPVEGVFSVLLPFIGAAGDLALDGAEAIIGPVVIATLLLPLLAPADLVRDRQKPEVARDERISKPSVSRMIKKFYEKEQKKLGLDVKLT
jgi:hypothetical protein